MTRLATGIQGFDAMVQGGLPLGSSVVLQGPPGKEKLQFALTFLAEGLKAGASGLVVISSESPDAVLAELRGHGVDLDAVTAEQRLRIVDWYSWSEEKVSEVEERGIVVRSSIDLTNLGVALSRAMAALSNRQSPRAVIEMLSPATNVYEVTQVYAFAQSAKKKFDRFGFTSLVLLEKDMHSAQHLPTLHQPFDGVIEIERGRSGDRIQRKIGVLHLKETAADPTFRSLEITEAGLRVVRESAAPSPTPSIPTGAVLETQEERARRLSLIMQIAGERLKLNPRDADALFAMAAAQATLDDARGGLQSLERLAELDPHYPGLWVLKTKLHARLGESERARESRAKGQQVEAAEERRTESTVPCPMCEAPIAVDATVCGNCGVKFSPSEKLEDELDDLGRAAIQEMVQEELDQDAPRAPPRLAERRPMEPTPKPVPKKGLTNGLVLARSPRRPAGKTNGLRGRTNGLRGRTNGLTNGLGRTNGLTNGIGRTNGLTNGLGRTNGLTNGLGRTNGLTNGLGRTNGLTNGLGAIRPAGFRSTGFRGMMQSAGWKLYVIPLVVVGLLLMPLFLVPEYNGPQTPIHIDGQFGDWTSISTAAMVSGSVPNPNVDIVRFGVVDNLGPQAFYVQVAGTALLGGGASPGIMDSVRIFVDTDQVATTGYRIDGLGADRLIEVAGYGGIVRSSTLWEFDSNRDVRDWGGWIKGTSTAAAVSGSQIEAEAEWLVSPTSTRPFAATVHAASWDGETDAGDFPVGPSGGSLTVVTDPLVPAAISGSDVPLLRLTLLGHAGSVTLDSVQVQIVGTAPPTSALSLRLSDGATVLSQVTPASGVVTFSFTAITVGEGTTTTLSIVGDFSAAGGETFGVRLPTRHPFGLNATAVGLRENAGARTVGYLGSVPGTPRVDGGFGEWGAARSDAVGDVGPRANPNIDLTHDGARYASGSTYLYADVTGRILRGTPVPEAARPTPVQGPSPPDTDRDTVPDSLDPLPLDFNNDGIPDGQTNGDYDGDGTLDHGVAGGTDAWLNTTLPLSFPAPFGGRSVTVYIGPTERPPTLGEDVLRFFLDMDNSTATGYLIGGIGADRQVELRGKDAAVTQAALLAFAGSFPGEWRWSPLLPVTVATGHDAVETSVSFAVANLHVESGDFWGSADSAIAGPAYASRSSFAVSGADKPLSVPWMQVGPQAAGTLIDPGSNSASTVYNHQRKVVRAGDVSGDTACDATNSDGCWYTVFSDQLVEATTNTAASTETITLGTNCGGTFPTDIQTSNNAYLCYREAAGPTFQAISAIAASTGSDVTVTLPAHATDDILLLLGWVRDVDDTVSVSGWTAISGTPFDRGTTARYWMFWKRAASSSETNPLFDKSGTTGDTYAAVITYRGAITTGNPWEVVGPTSTGTSDPASITGITTLTANALVVVPLGGENNNNAGITTTGTDPAAYAEHYLESDIGSDGAITFSEAVRPAAGATGTISVNWDSGNPNWGGKALSLASPASPNYQLDVKYDFTGVPSGSSYTLKVEAFHTAGEDFLVQVVDSTESTWTTRMTIVKTSDDNTDQTYTLTADEYDSGSPNIRFIGSTESGDTTQNDLLIDKAIVDTNAHWDRIVLMRSSDTTGSAWGSQVILASGRSADTPLLHAFDSAEPSIAIDGSGYLHLVWVSASSSGDQATLNQVRYAKTSLAYPTQSEIATAANWAVQTSYFPVTETATLGANCGGTFPTDLQSSNNAYLCYREAAGPTFQAISAIAASSGSDVTVTLPAHATDDILLLLGWVRDVDDTVSVSGWTAISGTPFDRGTTARYWMFWKRAASSSETNPLFDKSGTTGDTYAAVITYRGAITTGNPWEVVGPTSTGTSDPASITGITTLTANALVVVPLGYENDNNVQITTTGTDPAAYAEHYLESGTSSNGAITFSEAVRTSAGATGAVSVDFDVSVTGGDGWGGKALSLASPASPNYQLSVRHDWTGIPTDGDSHDVCVEAYVASAGGESMLVQVLTPPSTWNTRITVSKTSDDNADQCYTLTSSEFNAGVPSIRWMGGSETSDSTQSDLQVDQERIVRTGKTEAVDTASAGFMPTVSTDSSNNPHIAWSGSKTSGTAYYKNKAVGAWRSTVSWGTTYTGISVDVSPQNNHVSIAGYYQNPLEQADIAYRSNTGSNTINSTKMRTWDGSTWSAETEQATAGSPIRAVRMAWSPVEANTRIIVTQSDDGWLDAYVCTHSCSVQNNIGQVWSTAPPTSGAGSAQSRFDIGYEQVSGHALLVYHKQGGDGTQDIAYRTYAGGSWTAEQYIDDTGHGSHAEYFLIKLASKESSDQIGLVGAERTNNDVNAWIWSGSGWGDFIEVTGSPDDVDADNADIAWESNSGHLLVVATTTTTDIVSKEFTASWGGPVNFACISSAASQMRYPRLKANPLATANDMLLAVIGGYSLNTCYWTGSGWANWVSHGGVHQEFYRVFDFAWEATGSKGLLVYSGTDSQITYRTFTAPNSWGGITNVPMGPSTNDLWVQARTNPFPQMSATKVLGVALDNSNPKILGAFRWDGSTFTVIGTSAITADIGGFIGSEMFDLKYREVDVGGTGEIHHMVCKTLSPPANLCDTSAAFTKWDGTAGADAVATVSTIATVQSITTTSFPTDSTTHNVQMPATVNAGDLLIVFIATDGTPGVTTPAGWTWFFGWDGWGGATNKFSMFAKRAAGTEDGTMVDFQTTVAEKAAAQVYRVTGWRDSGTLTNDIEWSNAGATSANPNPPSLNPAVWDVEPTLWIAAYGADGDQDASAYPAFFIDGVYTQSDSSATSASMGSAWRSALTASEDPGTFTVAASEFWIASTVGVRSSEPRYPSLATTYESNGDLWVAYDKDVDGTTRAIYARLLDYPSGWQTPAPVDSLNGTIFTKPSIGIDRNNDVHALYVAATGPQVYYNRRTNGMWGAPEAVDASSTHPTLVVRAPNDVTYGNILGGLYWKDTTSETYFYYIPEFEQVVPPILGVLAISLLWARRRRRGSQESVNSKAAT